MLWSPSNTGILMLLHNPKANYISCDYLVINSIDIFNWCSSEFRTCFCVGWGNITLFFVSFYFGSMCLMTILHILCIWMCFLFGHTHAQPLPLSIGHMIYPKLLCMPLCEKKNQSMSMPKRPRFIKHLNKPGPYMLYMCINFFNALSVRYF